VEKSEDRAKVNRGLRGSLRRRPLWIDGLLAFCAWMTFVYVPWDFLVKPVAQDEEVWFGIVLRGWPAKAGEPLHWLVYALGTYGFWHMKRWLHPWAALYVGQVALSMLVWGLVDERSPGAWAGVVPGLVFAGLAAALWRSRELFREP
jgi:hypothetical protein